MSNVHHISPRSLFDLVQSNEYVDSVQDAFLTIAALIYLRWVDVQESEREAMSIFDETEYSPLLPEILQWRNWHLEEEETLHEVLTVKIPQELFGLINRKAMREANGLHCIAPVLEKLNSWSLPQLSRVVSSLGDLRLETRADQRALLQEFDDHIEREIYERKIRLAGGHMDPPWVSELVAELATPNEPLHIYDPCFGSANFLVAIFDKFSKQAKEEFKSSADSSVLVSGVEINRGAYVIGLTRLALAGVSGPQLELGNSLERTAKANPEELFDLVVLNPPWGSRMKIADPDRFPVPTDDSSLLFVQQALTHLKPAGKAVIVVPQGLLFREGAPKELREWLLINYSVDAVISIPEGAFRPYTGIATAILVISQRDPAHYPMRLETDTVRMFDTESFVGQYHDMTRGLSSDQCRQIAMIATMDGPEFSQAPFGWLTVQEHFWDVSLKELEQLEWDLTPRRRDHSALKDILEAFGEDLEVVPLSDLCDISPGSNVKSSPTNYWYGIKPEERDSLVALVEGGSTPDRALSEFGLIPAVTSIQYGEVRPSGYHLSEDRFEISGAEKRVVLGFDKGAYVKRSLMEKRVLKRGDVLITRSAEIGKAAVVGKTSRATNPLEASGGIGGIASTNFWVLRKIDDRIDPDYLAAYLHSKESQIWLKSRATGTSRSQLRRSAIDQLLIPVPSLSLQRRAIEAYEVADEDVLEYLSETILGSNSDPVVDWMNGALEALSPERSTIDDLLGSKALGEAMRGARNLVELASTEPLSGVHRDSSDLTHWFLSLANLVADPLRGCLNVPEGPALFSLIQQIDRSLEETQSHLSDRLVGNLPNTSKARLITKMVAGSLKVVSDHMLSSVEVEIQFAVLRLTKGASILELDVHNRGVLPLRNFVLAVKPAGTHRLEAKGLEMGYFQEGETLHPEFEFQTPLDGGQNMSVTWSAIDMDGKELQGSTQIALVTLGKLTEWSDAEKTAWLLSGPSPYITGDPLLPQNEAVFYGRDDLLAGIKRQVQSGNVVLLEGNRRAGKTSILKHLEGDAAVEGWLGIYTSMQGANSMSNVDVFRYLAREIASSIHRLCMEVMMPNGQIMAVTDSPLILTEACREGISEEEPFVDFREFFESAAETLALHNLKLLLMLDEFDKLQQGIDEGTTSPQVPENIRFLVQNYSGVSAVLTGSRRLKRLREEYWSALYGLGTLFHVTYLEADASRQLVVEPVEGKLFFAQEAIKRAVYLTSGQPYLLQCLCNRIYDLAVQLGVTSITLDIVNQSATQLVHDNEHFASLWGYAGSDRKRYLLVLCHKWSDNDDPLRLGVIQERLAMDGLEADDRHLMDDLDFLRELELVELEDGGRSAVYKLAIPLLGLWIDQERDAAAVLAAAKISAEGRDD